MRASHSLSSVSVSCDEPNLVSGAGLLPAAVLAQKVGLAGLVEQRVRVGAENSVTSCDLHVLVDEATERVSSDRPNGCPGMWGSAARGRALMQRPVRSVRVVVLYVFTQHDVEVTWSGDEEMVEAFAA